MSQRVAPSSGPSLPPPPPHVPRVSFMVLRVAPSRFRLVWIAMLLSHLVCAAFLLASAGLYLFLDDPAMTYYADLVAPRRQRHFTITSVVFALLSLAHITRIIGFVRISMTSRRLLFHRLDAVEGESAESSAFSSIKWWNSISMWQGSVRCSRAVNGVLFDRQTGLFGLESKYFERLFLLREWLEVVTQTYQVYRSSRLIAKPWINHVYVAMIVANCWSTPIIQISLKKQPAMGRVVCLCVDFALGVGSAIVLPIVILIPYAAAFDVSQLDFSPEDLYNEVWFTSLVLETRLALVSDTAGFISRVIAHISICSCLLSIDALVRPQWTSGRQSSSSKARLSMHPSDDLPLERHNSKKKLPHQLTTMLSMRLAEALDTHESIGNLMDTKWYKVVLSAFTAWGALVFALHAHAQREGEAVTLGKCHQYATPWFASGPACSVLEYNCWRMESNGGSVPESALASVDYFSVRVVILSHCSNLRVPVELGKLNNLIGLEIFNSSIVDWDKEASPTAAHHPALLYVYITGVNLTAVPDALNHDALPDSLTDVEISRSNLVTLPLDVGYRWSKLSTLYIEFSLVEQIPAEWLRLPVLDLSFIGNPIVDLPDGAFFSDVPRFASALWLSQNPIELLPQNGTVPIGVLGLECTRIDTLPSWISDQVVSGAQRIHLGRSPICDKKSDIAAQKVSSACAWSRRSCQGRYPWELVLSRRIA